DWTAEGRINGGIKFDNDDEGLVLADHNGPLLVAGSVGMTMSVWVRPGEGLDLDIQEILTMESGSDDVYQLAMKWMGSSAGYGIYAKFDTTGGLTPITQTHHFTPLEGTWYHVAVTWNGGMAKTYLNGTLVDERT